MPHVSFTIPPQLHIVQCKILKLLLAHLKKISAELRPELCRYHNGIIVSYLLNLTTADELEGELHESNESGIVVYNLLPHKTYMISIAASTSAGMGPFSEIVTFITPEDG